MSASNDPTETALATTSAGDGGSAALEVAQGERYTLLDRLGEGGMGVVWAAHDRRLDRKVALKILNDRFLGAANQARLASEAKAMARLAHPNVVPVFDAGERDGRAFLTMELVKGRSLSEWLRERRSWQEIVDVFRAAARGLAAAHSAGIVHRDVKPGNILVGDDGRTRVADFGVSRADASDDVAAPSGAITADTTGLVGSPAYMAPEQLRAKRADARCDQFGLCVAMYEALTNERPFPADSFERLLDAIVAGPPPLEDTVPDWLARVVTRGLAADPAARFPSMNALADALEGPAPSRVRRNAVIGALVVASSVGAVLASGALRDRGTAPAVTDCAAEASTEAERSWNPERKQALVAGFMATGADEAAAQADRVAGGIDRHVNGWKTRWETTCRAARIDHSWPEDIGVLSRACLDQQRAKLGALVDALTRADTAAVSRGFDLVRRLDPPLACGDPDLLRGQIAPPRDPARAADIAVLEERFSALGAAISLRRTGEVERDLPAFAADASKSGDPRLETGAVLMASRVARDRGDLDTGVREAKRAYTLARRHRDVVQAAEAAADLVWLLGYYSGDAVAGQEWADLALAELASIPDARVAISVHQAIGVFAESLGQGPRSIDHQRKGLELARRHAGPDHYQTAKSIELLASALGEGGHPADAAALYAESMPLVAKAYGEASKDYAHLLSHYSITLKDAGDDDRAIAIAEKALEVSRAAALDGANLGGILLNYGAVLQEAKRIDEAVATLRAAREAYLAAGQPGIAAQAQLNLGGILVDELEQTRSGSGDPSKERQALRDLEEAEATIAKELGPDNRDVALALTSQARLHEVRGRCAKAIPLAERAVTIYEQSPDLPDIADPLVVLGRCRVAARRAAEGVAFLERASKAQHAHGNDPEIAARIDADLERAREAAGVQ